VTDQTCGALDDPKMKSRFWFAIGLWIRVARQQRPRKTVSPGGNQRHSANSDPDFRTGRAELLTARFRVRVPVPEPPSNVQVRLLGDKTASAAVRLTFGTCATATSVPTRHSPAMREMSVTEQRYKAVQAVLAEGLGDHSSRPAHCPHQMSPEVEATVLEMRRAHPYRGARRIAFELARKGVLRR
jgi:hypothetical protein